MREVRKILLSEYYVTILLIICLAALFESGVLPSGEWFGEEYNTLLMMVQVIMQLATLALMPLALYLFRIRKIQTANDGEGEDCMRKRFLTWSVVRMSMLCVPMLLNTLFYYMFGSLSGFFYLALILFLASIFVYPTEGRCSREFQLFCRQGGE